MGKVMNEGGKSDFYETFQSGKAVNIPPGESDSFSDADGSGLGKHSSGGSISEENLSVPEVPSSKR